MKRSVIIFLIIVFLPILVFAQGAGGQVRRPVNKSQTKTNTPPKKKSTSKKQSDEKPAVDTPAVDTPAVDTPAVDTPAVDTPAVDTPAVDAPVVDEPTIEKPVEAAGYDVTFSCNVPTAMMYIDDNNYGTASGSRFLKTGFHTVRLDAEGYESLSQTIQVYSSSRSFSFAMKKNVIQLPPVIQNLINNMVHVEGGTFTMGATSEQGKDAASDEKPAHQVSLTTFSIGKYEVTQEEWQAVMGSNPSNFKGSKRPVEDVSWKDCQEFIRKLNAMTGKRFRLPTEAEWEYAARGGNKSIGYKYSGSDDLLNVAWYDKNSGSSTHDVGQKSPNELGLYDMSGNVWEWCQDRKGKYDSGSQTNPTGSTSGSYRVFRGGGWNASAVDCRASDRDGYSPGRASYGLGFRLAL